MVTKEDFLLDPKVIYMNHASYGAMPKKVWDFQIKLRQDIENNPTAFMETKVKSGLEKSRKALAKAFSIKDCDNLLLHQNATEALNMVGKSLVQQLLPGDEVLLTDGEYGAQKIMWEALCKKHNLKLCIVPVVEQKIEYENIPDFINQYVTNKTRILLVSHVTSSSSQLFPVKDILKDKREKGIYTIVDGAHAPGQICLQVDNLDCDVYIGDLHKWACCPRSCAFQVFHPSIESILNPLHISWGGVCSNQSLQERIKFSGTRDFVPWLSIPTALQFLKQKLDPARGQALKTAHYLDASLQNIGVEKISTKKDCLFMQSYIVPFELNTELHIKLREFGVEIWSEIDFLNRNIFRISTAWYNTEEDVDQLLNALSKSWLSS